jgi:hypothetical protein
MEHVKKAMKGVKLAEKQIETLTTYMDWHLDLLWRAMKDNDKALYSLQIDQLTHISKRLNELEYFPYQPIVKPVSSS